MTARRRKTDRRGLLTAGLASGVFHIALLAGLLAGLRGPPSPPEPPSIVVDLVAPPPPERLAAPRQLSNAPLSTLAPAAAPRPARPVPALAKVPPSSLAAPAAAAPSPFTVGGPGSAGEQQAATRGAARGAIGCAHADFLKLTKAEKAACADSLGQKALTAPLYAVIDPEKKAAFDGDCKKDDEWCQYRIGKGPYPGLFALGKKKKRPGWDD